MSDDTRRKVALIAHGNIEVQGEGDSIKLALTAHRKKKSGAYEFFEIDLDVGRWTVKRLMKQIATMHVRDRERLQKERQRIDTEVEAIKQPEDSK